MIPSVPDSVFRCVHIVPVERKGDLASPSLRVLGSCTALHPSAVCGAVSPVCFHIGLLHVAEKKFAENCCALLPQCCDKRDWIDEAEFPVRDLVFRRVPEPCFRFQNCGTNLLRPSTDCKLQISFSILFVAAAAANAAQFPHKACCFAYASEEAASSCTCMDRFSIKAFYPKNNIKPSPWP